MCSQGGLTWKPIRNMMSWASPSPHLLMQKLGDGGGTGASSHCLQNPPCTSLPSQLNDILGSLKLEPAYTTSQDTPHPTPETWFFRLMAGGGPPSDSDTHACLRTLGHTKLHKVGSNKRDFFKTSPICQDVAAVMEKNTTSQTRETCGHTLEAAGELKNVARVCPGGLHPPTGGGSDLTRGCYSPGR